MHNKRPGVVFNPPDSPQGYQQPDIEVDVLVDLLTQFVKTHLRNPRKRELEELITLCVIKED